MIKNYTIHNLDTDDLFKKANCILEIEVEEENPREFWLDDDLEDREIKVIVYFYKDWEKRIMKYLFESDIYEVETLDEIYSELNYLDLYRKDQYINIEINEDDLYYDGEAIVKIEGVR